MLWKSQHAAVAHLARLGRVLAIALCLGMVQSLQANPEEQFQQANRLFEAGKYEEAANAYETVVEMGNYSANLFYNLGNAYFKLDQPGKALLNYERAVKLDRRHPEALSNRDFVRARVGYHPSRPAALTRALRFFSADTYTILIACGVWLSLFSVAGILLPSIRERSVFWLTLACGAGLLLVATAGVTLAWPATAKGKEAMVTSSESARVLYAPAETANKLTDVPVGSGLRILDSNGEWAYCVLSDGRRGWLKNSQLEELVPFTRDS